MTIIMGDHVPRMEKDVSLSRFSTMRVGGIAKTVWFPQTERQASFLFRELKNCNCRFIGNGSNVLFADGIIQAPLIYMGQLREISLNENGVYASAGVPLPLLFSRLKHFGFTGGEFLAGIPGTVGGGVLMNAGAFGKCMADVLTSVRTLEGDIPVENCAFGYRNSKFLKEKTVVLGATFFFPKGDSMESDARLKRYRTIRQNTQPLNLPSLGSVFRAENGVPAWEYIHGAGLRGFSIGGAQVSEKHANFIVNTGNATASDVFSLIQTIKKRVFEKHAVSLKEEIQYIGEFYDSNC